MNPTECTFCGWGSNHSRMHVVSVSGVEGGRASVPKVGVAD